MVPNRDLPRRRPITCPWSSRLYLLEILATVETSSYVFRGVLAEMVDENGRPLPPPLLLWVLDTGSSLQIWYDIGQRLQMGDLAYRMIEDVIAHHEDAAGDVYYAIRWQGYLCPVWVLEEDVPWNDLMSEKSSSHT